MGGASPNKMTELVHSGNVIDTMKWGKVRAFFSWSPLINDIPSLGLRNDNEPETFALKHTANNVVITNRSERGIPTVFTPT
jgi:hypothetical protein